MKLRLTIFTFIICAAISAVSAQSAIQRYELDVNDFNTLIVENSIRIDLKCSPDSAGKAVFYATPPQSDEIFFSNNNKGRLTLSRDPSAGNDHPPFITLYSSGIKKIVNSGDSLVRIDSIETTEKFQAILIGNGRLVVHDVKAPEVDASIRSGHGQLIIDGSCTKATLSLVGTGIIQADHLDCVNCKTSVVGTGTIGVNPSESITITGMGSGNVWYRTVPPTIKSRGVGLHHGKLE